MSHLSIANRSRLSHTQSSVSESADTGRLGNRLLWWIKEGHVLLSRFIRYLYSYYVSPQRETAPEHRLVSHSSRRAVCEPREKGTTSQRNVQNVIPEPEYSASDILWDSDNYPPPRLCNASGKGFKAKACKTLTAFNRAWAGGFIKNKCRISGKRNTETNGSQGYH